MIINFTRAIIYIIKILLNKFLLCKSYIQLIKSIIKYF